GSCLNHGRYVYLSKEEPAAQLTLVVHPWSTLDRRHKKERVMPEQINSITTAADSASVERETKSRSTLRPVYRRLRGYAFDPSLSEQLDTAVINQTIYKVMWEEKSGHTDEGLKPGPVGEYLEVVDYDPASGCFYEPVDLNNEYILAQDGLPPSEGN